MKYSYLYITIIDRTQKNILFLIIFGKIKTTTDGKRIKTFISKTRVYSIFKTMIWSYVQYLVNDKEITFKKK